MAPTLVTACTALPPEGAACRGSKSAHAGLDGMQRGCVSQPGGLQGLRLRPGEAGSAAPAGEEGAPTLVVSHAFGALPLSRVAGAVLALGGPALRSVAELN